MDNKGREILKQLLKLNRSPEKIYLFKEIFGQLWKYKYRASAEKFYDRCKDMLKWNRFKFIREFIKMIDRNYENILNFCYVQYSPGYIEGSNLKIKNIIRRAFGYRDMEAETKDSG